MSLPIAMRGRRCPEMEARAGDLKSVSAPSFQKQSNSPADRPGSDGATKATTITTADSDSGQHGGRPDKRRVDSPAPNALDQPASMLCQFVLDGVESGLGALLILVSAATAHADSTDLHLVRCYDW
jgi:hypothetical protein